MNGARNVVLSTCCLLFLALALAACGSRIAPASSLAAPSDAASMPAGSMAGGTSLASAPAPSQPRVRVPILMYHHITILKATAGADWREITVTPDEFTQQMAYLRDHGYKSIHFSDLIAHFEEGRPLPEKPMIITFDDAWDDGYVVGYPLLKKYGFTATYFIPANWIGQVDGTMTWDQIAEMSAAGMEIGSHSMTHPFLTKSKPEMLDWELENSKARIEKYISQTVTSIAYPYGFYDDNIIAKAQGFGYKAGVTIEKGIYASPDRMMTLPRVGLPYEMTLDQFVAQLETPGPGE